MSPAWPGTIIPASADNHPHVNVRTRTAIAAPYEGWHAPGMAIRLLMAVTLLLVGVVWILQGLDVLGGSGMSGHIEWTVIGAILVVGAIALLVGARKLNDE